MLFAGDKSLPELYADVPTKVAACVKKGRGQRQLLRHRNAYPSPCQLYSCRVRPLFEAEKDKLCQKERACPLCKLAMEFAVQVVVPVQARVRRDVGQKVVKLQAAALWRGRRDYSLPPQPLCQPLLHLRK